MEIAIEPRDIPPILSFIRIYHKTTSLLAPLRPKKPRRQSMITSSSSYFITYLLGISAFRNIMIPKIGFQRSTRVYSYILHFWIYYTFSLSQVDTHYRIYYFLERRDFFTFFCGCLMG